MSNLTTGMVYFSEYLSNEQLDDISFFIQGKANGNRIGINLDTNISGNARTKCPDFYPVIYGKKQYPEYYPDEDGISRLSLLRWEYSGARRRNMIFELTEAPWYCHSEGLYSLKCYDETGHSYYKFFENKMTSSRLFNIQKLFIDLLEHELIASIVFELEGCYARPEDFAHYDVKAAGFCDALNDAFDSRRFATPAVRVNITK